METAELSAEDKEFLAKCEEQFKDRYTDKDEEFMKVFNRVPSTPPIIVNWLPTNNFVYRHDRWNHRKHPFGRPGNRNRQGDSGRNHRGYNDYNNTYNRSRYQNK